ncbi:MAG: hypothetical protein U9N61_10850 [Euryarchaeota archaeon]|nr:hypothetical protein [Euryarchaeota archaeon]
MKKAWIKCRHAVVNFSRAMEEVLRQNDYKGKVGCYEFLLGQLLEEVIEFARAKTPEEKQKECCDIANFAMMIFDNNENNRDG